MDQPINCLIVDDEPLAGQLLSGYVERSPTLQLSGVFHNPIEALQFLRKNPVDLILLDVQMEELNGLQFARIVGQEIPIILTTAYEKYALESYQLRVVDYLLKPIGFERFQEAVEKVRPAEKAVPSAKPEIFTKASPYIFVKVGSQHQRVDLDQIKYLSSDGDYLSIYLTSGKRLLTLENLSSLAGRLPVSNFCRIHRSHLVALDKINFVERNRVVIGEVYLPVSQSYQEDFWKLVNGK